MFDKTKWILAGGAAAVALSPVAAFASGHEVTSAEKSSSAVTTAQSDPLAADATAGVLPAVDPTAVTPNTPNTANTPNTPNTAVTPASPVSAKSPVSPMSPVSPKSPASA